MLVGLRRMWLHSRVGRAMVAVCFLVLIYILWPVSEMRQKSEELEKGWDSTLRESLSNDEEVSSGNMKDLEYLYLPKGKPLRGSFNPDTDQIEISHQVDTKRVDQALRMLRLTSIKKNDDEFRQSLNYNFLGDRPADSASIKMKEMSRLKSFITGRETGGKGGYNMCNRISYAPELENQKAHIMHSQPLPLGDSLNMKDIRRYLQQSGYANVIDSINLHTMKQSDWYRFSGSSTWLPHVGCYLMASRLMYAPGRRGSPVLSLVWMQLFDTEWREIKGKRLRYLDVKYSEADEVLRRISLLGGHSKRSSHLLDRISLKFPAFMDISITSTNNQKLLGPEDPRIITRSSGNDNNTEPIVIFSMRTGMKRRSMFAAFPLRRSPPKQKHRTPKLQFRNTGTSSLTVQRVEKNWMPFFDDPRHPDHINFIYGLEPLVIFRCELKNGKCDKMQDDQGGKIGPIDSHKIALRGGTELVKIPDEVVNQLPSFKKYSEGHAMKLWVGFAKIHAWECGCGDSTYRPILFVLSKLDGQFRIDLMSQTLDFDLDVLAFDGLSTKCTTRGPNVLSPNSIAFWNFTQVPATDSKSQSYYDDLMGITISEADRNVKIIYLKNVLNYVADIYSDSILLQPGPLANVRRTRQIEQCVLEDSIRYCKAYNRGH